MVLYFTTRIVDVRDSHANRLLSPKILKNSLVFQFMMEMDMDLLWVDPIAVVPAAVVPEVVVPAAVVPEVAVPVAPEVAVVPEVTDP
jgi:hypothetical protein